MTLKKSKKAPPAPTAACLFAGMGGFADGFLKAGFNVLWGNDIDKYVAVSFRHNYPDIQLIERDVRDVGVKKDRLAPVDVLTAGFPCQSFSISGDKGGFDDARGQLFFEIIRLIGEFGKHKPKILLLENVPNLMGGSGGVWFEQITLAIQKAGYWFDSNAYQILNTCEITNIPQDRERLFMAAVSTAHFKYNGFEFPAAGAGGKLLRLSKFVNRVKKAPAHYYLHPDNRYYKLIAAAMDKGDRKSLYQLRRYEVREKPDTCPTLTANMGGGGHNVPFVEDKWGIRRLLTEECAKLQGFENYEFPDDVPGGQRYQQIGNAVSAPVAEKLAYACKNLLNQG